MNSSKKDVFSDATLPSIMAALEACYGNLAQPDFQKIYTALGGPIHQRLIEELRPTGMRLTETTNLNDDVANHLVISQGDDRVGLALSGLARSQPCAVWIARNCLNG